ncbi:MAG: hypothetical protein M3162_06915 [Thermoproteota archaeon]|nr:hypothetical protein [Thermoproteota archaeon]
MAKENRGKKERYNQKKSQIVNASFGSIDKKGIAVSLLSGLSLLVIFFLYSRSSSPDTPVMINSALYSFATITIISFFVCLIFFFFGIKKAFFSKKSPNGIPSKLVHNLQRPFQNKKFKGIFLMSSIAYFVFFGFLSNMFIIFYDDQTMFSIIPPFVRGAAHGNTTSPGTNQQQQQQIDQAHDSSHNPQNEDETRQDNNKALDLSKTYPSYRMIICCKDMGYVPMLITYISPNLSFLLIPINFAAGLFVSVLVGLNVALNVFLLQEMKAKLLKLSKKSILGVFGISSGLFIGCPTCAGSLFYSVAGFSSIVAISSLSLYQVLFVLVSIPLLMISIVVMTRILKEKDIESCNYEGRTRG